MVAARLVDLGIPFLSMMYGFASCETECNLDEQ